MLNKALDKAIRPVAKLLDHNSMQTLGVNNTMKIARSYNRLKYRKYHEYRRSQYLNHFDELIRENGLPVSTPRQITDGWALGTSGELPHLGQLLKDADEIIKERGGIKRPSFGRSYFQEVPIEDLLDKYPSILDFATSSDVLSTVCNYLGFIPVFSGGIPDGIRFNESWVKFDETPGSLRASQLFHLDYHDSPMVYVIVVLRDVAMENGPFCLLPASVSEKALQSLDKYHTIRGSHRVSDKEMYNAVSESELKKLCYPAGTVLFLDNSKCFHYGSRNTVNPRYLLMYAYLSTCRTDFGEVLQNPKTYPVRDSDSRLRKMVLRREFME